MTQFTTTRKLLLAELPFPSATVSVIIASPNWSASGVMVTVRFALFPPKTILAFGMRLGLEEVPFTIRLAAGVSGSPTVNAIGPEAVFSFITCVATGETVGFPLTATVNVWVTVLLFVWPSLTVTMMVAVPLALATGVNVSSPVAPGLV